MADQAGALLPTPQPLRVIWRLAAGGAALALATFGVLAVFRTRNDIGATALLVVATYLGLVSMLGRVPRLKFGDNEMDPYFAGYARGTAEGASDVREAVETAAEEATPETVEPAPAPSADEVSGLAGRHDLEWVRDVPRELVDAARQAELEARKRAIEHLLLGQRNAMKHRAPASRSFEEWRRRVDAIDHPITEDEAEALMRELPSAVNIASGAQEIRHQRNHAAARPVPMALT